MTNECQHSNPNTQHMPEDNKLDGNAVREVAALVRKTAQPIATEAIHAVIVPTDCQLKSLAEFQFPDGRPPSRVTANPSFRDGFSFCSYYSLFSDERSRLFGDPVTQSFLAILDYHGSGAAGLRKPEFCSHRANFKMVLDERWKIWADKSGKTFTQEDFAEFIEDNNSDILEPSGAAMLEVARDLKASISADFESKVTPKNGQVQIRYSENIDGKVGTGNVEIPELFKIQIPVFYGESAISITARLRYRIVSGKLTFTYKLYRQAEILNDAFHKAAGSIAAELKAEVLFGNPS